MKSKLSYFYDKEADIFYFSFGKPDVGDISEEIDDGVVARLDPKTQKVRGFTIIDFAKRSNKKENFVPLPLKVEFSLIS